jgi:hypothetical protein
MVADALVRVSTMHRVAWSPGQRLSQTLTPGRLGCRALALPSVSKVSKDLNLPLGNLDLFLPLPRSYAKIKIKIKSVTPVGLRHLGCAISERTKCPDINLIIRVQSGIMCQQCVAQGRRQAAPNSGSVRSRAAQTPVHSMVMGRAPPPVKRSTHVHTRQRVSQHG